MGLFALWGSLQALAGPITPLIFLTAMLITLPTAFSYAVLNRRFPSAGATCTWVWRSVSPAAGFQAGLFMMTYFLMACVSCPMMFSMFFLDLIRMIRLPISDQTALYVGAVVSTVPVIFSCLRGAEASVKATVRLMIAETLVVVGLSVTILVVKSPMPGALALAPLNPLGASNGLGGFWAATVLGIVAFCGFDVVSTAAEEARAPRKHVPRAIFITVVGMALFWAFNAWVLTLSTPAETVRDYWVRGVPAVTAIAQNYWGWGSLAIILTAFTGVTAVYISSVQGTSRMAFALARHGLLPSMFGTVSGPKRVPRAAVLAVILATVLLGFGTLYLLRNGLEGFNWWSYGTVFFATLTFMSVNVANACYFFRFARNEFRVVSNLLVPFAGIVINAYLIYAAFFSALWSSDMRIGKSVVLGSIGVLIAEIAVVTWLRLGAPKLFSQGAPIGVDEA